MIKSGHQRVILVDREIASFKPLVVPILVMILLKDKRSTFAYKMFTDDGRPILSHLVEAYFARVRVNDTVGIKRREEGERYFHVPATVEKRH